MDKVRNYLLVIGVMTGNSLDGVDVVLSRFGDDGEIEDLASHSVDFSDELAENLRLVRSAINSCNGRMDEALQQITREEFLRVHDEYLSFVTLAVEGLRRKAASLIEPARVDLIGFHGQTCAHLPPSVASKGDNSSVFTVQIGNGQRLADLTGTVVVCDFRSDDLMNGGEGAPLAPMHHFHLADSARKKGHFPIAFCNAGNTGNVTIISEHGDSGNLALFGWDTGPFNNYSDRLMQLEKGKQCDFNGTEGASGTVNVPLLRLLFSKAVVTTDGANFLLKTPPKSSDPQWYLMLPQLLGQETLEGKTISFADRLRTCQYFAAYAFVHSLSLLPETVAAPTSFALSGGGWRNPLVRRHFEDLLHGRTSDSPILTEHVPVFESLRQRLGRSLNGASLMIRDSAEFGYDSKSMEARIFADAAVCRVTGKPFTGPETTGCRSATVCGVIRFPAGDQSNATETLRAYLDCYNSRSLTPDFVSNDLSNYWSRAVAGWQEQLSKRS